MSLRTQAELDLATVLEASSDFGHPFTLTDPAGFSSGVQLYGATGDIGQLIDPETGQAVTGRHAALTVRMASLTANGYSSFPVSVADAAGLPWVVEFAGVSTAAQKYKVKQAWPDKTLGIITMVLELWTD